MRTAPFRTPTGIAQRWRAALAGFGFLAGLVWLVDTAVDWILDDAARQEVVIARLAAHQLDQTIRAGKIILSGAALQAESDPDLDGGIARALAEIAPRLALEPQFTALSFFDARGRVVRSSDGRGADAYGGVPPEFFEGAARGGEFHLGYGLRPGAETELAVARGLRGRDGEFLGVAAIKIDLGRIRESLDASVTLGGRRIVAMRPDGVALFRVPEGIDAAGRDLSAQPYARAMLAGSPAGVYDAPSAFDGMHRVGGYTLSPDRDLLVMSGRESESVLRAALLGKGQTALIAAGLLALAAAGAILAAAELRRRRRMLDERDELLHSLDVADAGIATTDAETQAIRFVNQAFERKSGYTAAELLRKNCRFLQGPATDPAAVARIRENLAAGKPVRVDILNYHKDGTPFWSDLSIAPIRDAAGSVTGFVSAFLDITERVRMTAELNDALGRAQAADRAKSAFLARMSYELRTPLNAIIGFAEVMSARLMGPLPERYANYAGDIRDSGKHLLALVERILEMSRLEADSRPFEDRPVDLAEIARAAATLTRPEVDGAAGRIEIESGGPAIARGDATALRQIAVDLLVNAARHGRKGGRIVVRTGPGAGGRVRLTVADDGPGLPGDVLTGAGVPFLGRRSEVADGSGLGLGLAISTELVGRMGGNLELANADPGARVTLDMPAAEAARDAA